MKIRDCLIDLHVHLDGSMSAETARRLAELQKIDLGGEDDEKITTRLQAAEECQDLNAYLEKFEFPLSLLQTPAALSACMYCVLSEQSRQGIIYTEIRFAPQLHTSRGMNQEDAVRAAIEGMRLFFEEKQVPHKTGRGMIGAGIILCCMRGSGNAAENKKTVELAGRYLGNGVAAVDLAGAEALFPTAGYSGLFASVRKQGIPFTIHAGEAAGPDSIRMAVQYGAKRIGHGVRAVEDDEVMQLLAAQQITLELCPTSNLNTRAVSGIKDYPIRTFLEKGICVTVNTDNMSVSNTTVEKEFRLLENGFQLTDGEIKNLLLNAAEAAFTSQTVKNKLREKIEEQYALYCN